MNPGQMNSELQQLRKEVNELRERVAKLEARPVYTHPPITYPVPNTNPWLPFKPYEVTCKDGSVIKINSPIVAQSTSTVPRSESGLL